MYTGVCRCVHRAYLQDLALLGSQVALRPLEVPEMTVSLSIRSFMHWWVTTCRTDLQNSCNSNIQYIPHNFLEMQRSRGSTKTKGNHEGKEIFCWTLCGVLLVTALTELEFGGFGQGLPPPGPLEHKHTDFSLFCLWQAFLCFQFICVELATTKSPIARVRRWERQHQWKHIQQNKIQETSRSLWTKSESWRYNYLSLLWILQCPLLKLLRFALNTHIPPVDICFFQLR